MKATFAPVTGQLPYPRAMDASARQHRSRQRLLTELQQVPGRTRTELAEATGLSRSAVAETVSRLLTDGLLQEVTPAPVPGRRGRRPAVLVLTPPGGVVVGLDLGHSHLAAAIADGTGRLLASDRQQADVDRDALGALDAAGRLVTDLLDGLGLGRLDVRCAAVGLPGPVDLSRTVRSRSILGGWVDLDPAREFGNRLGVPVQVGNDADLGALGELRFGAARGHADVLYIKASHGIGAGLVLGGRSYRGATGLAGEIGHTQVPGAADWCRCGNRGCLETVVSVEQVRRQLQLVRPGSAGLLSPTPQDPVSTRILREAGRTIGQVVAGLCNALNPGLVLLGGELGASGEPFVSGVRDAVARYAQPANAAALVVRPAGLGLEAELMGAVALALTGSRSG